MAWTESHTVLLRHRKLRELAKELRLKPVYQMGHLHALWHAALEQQEDGDLSSWSDEFIADQSGYDGDAGLYVSLLQKHRWLDGRVLHDWLDYAGRFLISKYSTSKREKLVEIWAKYGLIYGERVANGKRTLRDRLANAPNQPNQPNLPNQSEDDVGPEVHGARQLFREHPMLSYSPKAEANVLKIYESTKDWQQVRALIDEAVENQAGDPCSYALGILYRKQKNKAAARQRSAVAVRPDE